MSYVESNLMTGERIEAKARIHWWAWAKGLAVLLIAFAVPETGTNFAKGFLGLLGLLMLINGVIVVLTTELAVTNQRVIAKTGLIRRNTVELRHGKVEGLTLNQSVFGRILGFGTVVVNGTGTGRTPFPYIADPLAFRKDALERIEQPA